MSRAEELIADLEAEIVKRDAKIAEQAREIERSTNMFHAAVMTIVTIGEAAGVRGEDQLNGSAEIVEAIDKIKSRRDHWRAKARQPSGAALLEPFEMRPFQTVDQGSTNFKAGFNAALRKVRENLNSPPVSAGGVYSADPLACSGCVSGCVRCRVSTGVVDERALRTAVAQAVEYLDVSSMEIIGSGSVLHQRLKAALNAQPDHSAQSVVSNISKQSSVLAYRLITKELETLANGSAIDRFRSAQNEFEIAIAASPTPGKKEGGDL